MKYLLFGTVFALVCLCGCTVIPFKTAKINVENSKKLRVGMTKHEVLAVMGEPLRDETFCKPDIWFYYFDTNWFDGFVTEDECFPLVFKDGKLLGWGNEFYTRMRIERRNHIQERLELPVETTAAEKK